MKAFPMFVRTTGRRIVIVGGGEQAAQKARLILKTDAEILLACPELDDELWGLVEEGKAHHHADPITPALFEDAAMTFVATGCPGMDASLHALVKVAKCPVNVVDYPELCDITTPAIVDRAPIVVAIGSEGTAPVLTREIKTKLETMLPQNLGGLAALAGRLRGAVAGRVPRENRRALWAWVFKGSPRVDWTRGKEREVSRVIKEAIQAGGPPKTQAEGKVSQIIPTERDLLTLRAVERLQEADVIFYSDAKSDPILELARRDAERVYIGATRGAPAWPAAKVEAEIRAELNQSHSVVCLTAEHTLAPLPVERIPSVLPRPAEAPHAL